MGNCHFWGDKDFDWKALDNAGSLISKICKWGRIGVHWKEKYGTLRISCYFWYGNLHGLTHPGYVYSQYPDWLWSFDVMKFQPFMGWTRLPLLVQWIQLNVFYRLAYYVAMKKYPHIAEEICVNADYPEFIIGGKEIHDKYWVTYENL